MITNYLTQPRTRYNTDWFSNEEDNVIGFQYETGKAVGWESGRINYPKIITREEADVCIKINGQLISLPFKLLHIANTIEQSKEILELELDWDGFNAAPINNETWILAVTFLINYSKFILDKFDTVILSPEINPCKNGTLDLTWKTKRARFLLNIKAPHNPVFASYYGDLLNNQQPIKSSLSDNSIIEYLAFWMKNLS